MFCWPCILIFFVMKTNQMHYLSLIYFVNQPLHVSGMFIAHHQAVFIVYVQQLVHVMHLTWLAAGWVRIEHPTFVLCYWLEQMKHCLVYSQRWTRKSLSVQRISVRMKWKYIVSTSSLKIKYEDIKPAFML
jgi:hypothetical protein